MSLGSLVRPMSEAPNNALESGDPNHVGFDRDFIKQRLRKLRLADGARNSRERQGADSSNDRVGLKVLERSIETLSKSRNSINDEINRYFEVHYAPSHLALCAAIQQHLPSELRKIIYEYILPAKRMFIEERHLHSKDPERLSGLFEEYWTNSLYCDEATSLEIMQWWYESRKFKFRLPSVVRDFLRCDMLRQDLPVLRLARNFDIELVLKDNYRIEEHIGGFECLAEVRNGAVITCIIETDRYDTRCPEDLLDYLRETLNQSLACFRKLVDADHKVSLKIESCQDSSLVLLTAKDLQDTRWKDKIEELCEPHMDPSFW